MKDSNMVSMKQLDNRWEVVGDVLIATVSRLLTQSQTFTIAHNTQVDFAKVTDVDSGAISLILEWKRRAARENQSLRFVNLPSNLMSLMRLYGVDEIIV